jgi:Tfp pilus assembly protein PilP
MKLIKILAIVTMLATAAIGQSDKGDSQAKATPSPAKAASPANAKGQPAAPSATTANQSASTKSAPAKKASATTKTAPGVKTGAVTPAAGAKTASTKSAIPATKTQGPGTAPAVPAKADPAKATAKTGAAAQPVKSGNAVAPGQKAVAGPATKKSAAAPKSQKGAGAPNTKKAAAKATTPKSAATKKVIATGKPVKAAVVPPKPAPPLEKKAPAKLMGAAGRRDPFISPIRTVSTGSPTGNCTTGKRCLAIPELILQGTVRDISGKMLAIVVTSNRRTYTLRENDQVYNGSVEKITSDSIIFREFVRDAVGRESAKEVVKKLSPTS